MFLAIAGVPAAEAGEPVPQLKLLGALEGASPREYTPVAFSPDGKTLACADFVRGVTSEPEVKENVPVVDSVKLWDVGKRKVIATLRDTGGDFNYRVYHVALSPGGKTVAATSSQKVTKFNSASGKRKTPFQDFAGPVTF